MNKENRPVEQKDDIGDFIEPRPAPPVEQKIEYCEGEDDIAFDFHKANDAEQKDEPKDDILDAADYAADNLPSSIKESNDPVTKLAFITGFVKGFKYAKPKVEPQPAPEQKDEPKGVPQDTLDLEEIYAVCSTEFGMLEFPWTEGEKGQARLLHFLRSQLTNYCPKAEAGNKGC